MNDDTKACLMTEEELKEKIDNEMEQTSKYLYVLDGKKVVPCKRAGDWSKLIQDGQARQVAVTHIGRGCNVSTMFFGMQAFENDDKGNPLVFETMIFGGENDGYCDKHGTWEDAELGHIEAIKVAMEIKKT